MLICLSPRPALVCYQYLSCLSLSLIDLIFSVFPHLFAVKFLYKFQNLSVFICVYLWQINITPRQSACICGFPHPALVCYRYLSCLSLSFIDPIFSVFPHLFVVKFLYKFQNLSVFICVYLWQINIPTPKSAYICVFPHPALVCYRYLSCLSLSLIDLIFSAFPHLFAVKFLFKFQYLSVFICVYLWQIDFISAFIRVHLRFSLIFIPFSPCSPCSLWLYSFSPRKILPSP